MSGGFHRHRRSKTAVATFSAFEADLLRSLARQMIELLRNEVAIPGQLDPFEAMLDFSGPTTAPEDPVLARLFPTAYADDEDAADFRRFTEGGLRESKASAAGAVIDDLEAAGLPSEPADGLFVDVELADADAWVWMRAFTDMRLAIATRLEIEEGDDAYWADLEDDDPRSQVHEIYQWIGYLQETLVSASR